MHNHGGGGSESILCVFLRSNATVARLLLACLFLLLFPYPAFAELFGQVVGVIDGDSIRVMHNGRAKEIRLSGVDCPEERQAFGQRAKQAASELVFGKEITLQTHGIDKYGHTIADVILLNLNRGRNTRWDLCELDC